MTKTVRRRPVAALFASAALALCACSPSPTSETATPVLKTAPPIALAVNAEACDDLNIKPATPADAARLKAAFEIIAPSATGQMLLRNAAARGLNICVLPAESDDFAFYQAKNNVMAFRSNLDTVALARMVAHELRHDWQSSRSLGEPLSFMPNYVAANRVMEADAEAAAHQVAAELREAGDTRMTQVMLRKADPYNDIEKAYENAEAKNPAARTNGIAIRAAFDQWYGNMDRVRSYDLSAVFDHLQRGDENLPEAHRRPIKPYGLLPGIGQMPNGVTYTTLKGYPSITAGRYVTVPPAP